MPRYGEPFGKQLATALGRQKVSQRALAKRLDPEKWESRRRWIGKLLSNDVETPEPESIAAIETALGLSEGYFKVRQPTPTLNRRDRLVALEAAFLQERKDRDLESAAQLVRLADLEEALEQVAPGLLQQVREARSK